MRLHNNKEILDQVSAKAELKKPLKDIFQIWPNLHLISLNLVDYMGDLVPASCGKPLLEVCLRNAVEAYRSVTAEEYGTAAQMVAFIRGLLKQAHEINSTCIGNNGDDPTLWEPFAEPLSSFQKTYSGLVTVYHDPYSEVKENSLRLMILSRIINVKDLQWIDRFSSLPTLLGEAA